MHIHTQTSFLPYACSLVPGSDPDELRSVEVGKAGIAGFAVAESGRNVRLTIQNNQLGGWVLIVDLGTVRTLSGISCGCEQHER
jgi:hypothetical protein